MKIFQVSHALLKRGSCVHRALTAQRWRVKLEPRLKREPEARGAGGDGGDVAENPSVDVPGGASISSGPPPHIQSLTLFMQHIQPRKILAVSQVMTSEH